MANYKDKDGNSVVNTESIDLVRGTRKACIAADLETENGTEDLLFAKGASGINSSGTIISGGIEYGLGVYYPSIDGTIVSVKPLGNIAAGKTPDYFKGRTIGDILDEALFKTPIDLSQSTYSCDSTIANGVNYQDFNFSSETASSYLIIRYTAAMDGGTTVSSIREVLLGNTDITDLCEIIYTPGEIENNRFSSYWDVKIPFSILLNNKFISTFMSSSDTIHTHVKYDEDYNIVIPTIGLENDDLIYCFTSLDKVLTSDSIVFSVILDGKKLTFKPETLLYTFKLGSNASANNCGITFSGTKEYSLNKYEEAINLSASNITKTAVKIIDSGTLVETVVLPNYEKANLDNLGDLSDRTFTDNMWIRTVKQSDSCTFDNTNSQIIGQNLLTYYNQDSLAINSVDLPELQLTTSAGWIETNKFLCRLIVNNPVNRKVEYKANEELLKLFTLKGGHYYETDEDGTLNSVYIPETITNEFTNSSIKDDKNYYLLKCYYSPLFTATMTNGNAPTVEASSVHLYLDKLEELTVTFTFDGYADLDNGLNVSIKDKTLGNNQIIESVVIKSDDDVYGTDELKAANYLSKDMFLDINPNEHSFTIKTNAGKQFNLAKITVYITYKNKND